MTTDGEIRNDKHDISQHDISQRDGLPAGRKVDGTDPIARQYLELASKYESEEILDSGLQDLEFANSLSKLVALLERQGKYDEAIPLCKRSLTIRTFALSDDNSEVAQNLYQLGGLLWKDQKYDEAVPFYERAFATRKLLPQGSEDPLEFAQSLSRLATMFERQGIYDDSITMRRRSLAICKLALGEDHPEVAGTLNDLAELLQRKFDQVDKVRQKASLITWRMSPLYTGPRILTGQTYLNEACLLHQQALDIRERVLAEDHPDLAQSLNNLAGLLARQGDTDDAVLLYQRAVAILGRVHGEEHPDTHTSSRNLKPLRTSRTSSPNSSKNLFKIG
eukprot:CAMPEP_0198203066 /NCGR_PEP_ID=MMETSP1445-20131203/6316_1 /TAXON_ID=36898 /ORGANISM="Pyramimonas sp., Strain CCMP2087" /LENGTH=334 /DNA_ID=CAMNT_0043874295 /DNA_START=342 /DNA_END=1346 /DNA_ORIENTATION=-